MTHEDKFKSGGYSKQYSDNYSKIDWGSKEETGTKPEKMKGTKCQK